MQKVMTQKFLLHEHYTLTEHILYINVDFLDFCVKYKKIYNFRNLEQYLEGQESREDRIFGDIHGNIYKQI